MAAPSDHSPSWRCDLNTPWDAFPSDLEPASDATGPFPHRAFLETVEAAIGTPDTAVHITATDDLAIALVHDADGFRFAGPADLTDYHTPLGSGVDTLTEALGAMRGSPFRLDSMPAAARDLMTAALDRRGAEYAVTQHDATAVLTLPSSFDEWLSSLGKKERHEVRRKRRRFEEEFGPIEVRARGIEAIGRFCAMHRTAHGAKGEFMTDHMESFFAALLTSAGFTIHELVCDGTVRAAAFGFEGPDGYAYYNSAYDPDAAMASPGVVLFSSLIAIQIERGARIFDFLKGDEPYKYRHGAQARPLFAAEGAMP